MIHTTYAGLRVLELTTTIAGPFCGMVLADLGADVVKVERPDDGDDARAMPPHTDGGESTVFLSVNRGKRSVVLDLKADAGREAFLRLVERSDVVVQSFRPGAAERLGLGVPQLRERNPALVTCEVSAFGNGPAGAGRAGYDPLVQAFTGLMAMTGHPGTPPARVAASLTDLSTGMWAAMGVMAALVRRRATGQPQHVEATLVDSGFALLAHQVTSWYANGELPEQLGSASPITAPYEAFRTADGWLMVAAGNQRLFSRLCQALQVEELLDDERFTTPRERVLHRTELHALLEQRTSARSTQHWQVVLDACGVPAGPVNDLAQALQDPVVAERGLLVPHGDGGPPTVRLPFAPPAAPSDARRAPRLGEHTDEVLAELT